MATVPPFLHRRIGLRTLSWATRSTCAQLGLAGSARARFEPARVEPAQFVGDPRPLGYPSPPEPAASRRPGPAPPTGAVRGSPATSPLPPYPDTVPRREPPDHEQPHPPRDRHIHYRRVVQPPVGVCQVLVRGHRPHDLREALCASHRGSGGRPPGDITSRPRCALSAHRGRQRIVPPTGFEPVPPP